MSAAWIWLRGQAEARLDAGVEMLRRAGMLLHRGESVVLDASWTDEAERRQRTTMSDDARLLSAEQFLLATLVGSVIGLKVSS